MKCVYNATEARANFSRLVTEAGYSGKEAVIERNNRPIAVIIGYEQYLELCRLAEERADRFAIYDEIRARNPDAELEQVEVDVAAAVDAVRGANN
jgi:prevent-host-death family protein